jgi:hypothetical protein
MIRNPNMLPVIFTLLIIGVSGCASNKPDPKPSEIGQCTVIRQDDANKFEASKQALIGKRYANYSKVQKGSTPQGPYILRDVSFSKLSDNGTWWGVRFNGKPIDVAETFIETSAGTFENLILVQSQFVSGSCDSQTLKFQKKLLLN